MFKIVRTTFPKWQLEGRSVQLEGRADAENERVIDVPLFADVRSAGLENRISPVQIRTKN